MCDLRKERANDYSEKFDVPIVESFEAVLESKEINAVAIFTQRFKHGRMVIDALKAGKLEEAWGCGTAAVVSPIGLLSYQGVDYVINDGKIGELTQHLYDELTGIQWGEKEDKFGWTLKV